MFDNVLNMEVMQAIWPDLVNEKRDLWLNHCLWLFTIHTAIFVNQTLSTSVCFWISITQFWRMIVGGREVVIQTWVKCSTTCGMCAHRCVLYTKFSFCREKPGPCGTLLASPSTVEETQISNRAKRICYKNKVTYNSIDRFIVIGIHNVWLI